MAIGAGAVLVYLFVPETKGKSLAAIAALFEDHPTSGSAGATYGVYDPQTGSRNHADV